MSLTEYSQSKLIFPRTLEYISVLRLLQNVTTSCDSISSQYGTALLEISYLLWKADKADEYEPVTTKDNRRNKEKCKLKLWFLCAGHS